MKQLSFLPNPNSKREHGGELAVRKRRSRRPLNIKEAVHLTLRSDLAYGARSLLRNKKIIARVLRKYSRRFRIRVYEHAVCGNHIHLLVKGQTRRELQYFFRVFSGQVAQEILKEHPLTKAERRKTRGGTPTAAEAAAFESEKPAGARRAGGTPATTSGRATRLARATGHPKNQRTFWSLLLYSRLVSWGREYKAVKAYVIKNTKEALGLIAYIPRASRYRRRLESG